MGRAIESCSIEVLKRDEPFSVGEIFIDTESETLRENDWMKPLPMTRYKKNQIALESAEKEGLISIHIDSKDEDDVAGEKPKRASSRPRVGKPITMEQLQKRVLAPYQTFSRFVNDYSADEGVLEDALKIAEENQFTTKAKAIRDALGVLLRRNRVAV